MDILPESLKAFANGWEEITKVNEPYTIVKKDDLLPCNNGKNLSKIYLNMAEKVTKSLNESGFTCTSYNIFTHLLSNIALMKIIEYTNQELVIMGHPITTLIEFKQFLGTRWLRSCLRVSSELAFNKMKEAAKYHGFVLMEMARYKNIHSCIRGFALKGRHKDFNN